ncbi:MAG: hypothetical protein KY468_15900 [Armatimonadetes bacterium]|nr:hypothetical protein [Armatimonadota bacterium]
MSHLDPENPLYDADVPCPRCGPAHHVPQVQGERCPDCGFEFKLFRHEEESLAREFYRQIEREKYFVEIPEFGFAVVHE